jgi:ribosomal protein L11 methyltransferase
LVVVVDCPPGEEELTAGRLWELGAVAVEIREHADATTLVAGMPTAAACRRAATALGGDVVEIDARTWQDGWRQFAEPVEVGDLVIAPAWRPVPLPDGRTVIEIDPGQCFGSGSHASTRGVLRELSASPPVGSTVLDVGTGSGILAVAAARLGASGVVAIDVDPVAPGVARANAARNGVADRVVTSLTPVPELTGSFDLALVNVTAGVHIELGPAVAAVIRPGGGVVVAGLLPGQWPHVALVYEGCDVVMTWDLDGWLGARLRRR